MTSTPLNPDALTSNPELFIVASTHHFHGDECLCGFKSARSRDRTEHIMLHTLAVAQPVVNTDKASAWYEGFQAGWEEAKDPGAFVNDVWDAETPNPYRKKP